jgi:hypothetical protein
MSMKYVEDKEPTSFAPKQRTNLQDIELSATKKKVQATNDNENVAEDRSESKSEEAAEDKAAPKRKKKLADTEVPPASEIKTKRKVKKNSTPPTGYTLEEPLDRSTEQTLDMYKTELNRPFENPTVLDAGGARGHVVQTGIVGKE